MSVLTMVRHGQASYMEVDYDKLSPAGEEQSRKLGQYWAKHGVVFDRILHGPANRHIRTMEIAGEIVRAAGLPWPDPEPVPDLDEFDAFTMMRLMTPVLVEQDSEARELNERFLAQQKTPEAGRHLQKLFEYIARRWASGDFETIEMETWAQFRSRIQGVIETLRASAKPSSRIAAFSSGGPIAASIGYVLDLNAVRTVEFVWLSRNCSYSQFLFSGDRISMHSFNAIPHLDDHGLLTYR